MSTPDTTQAMLVVEASMDSTTINLVNTQNKMTIGQHTTSLSQVGAKMTLGADGLTCDVAIDMSNQPIKHLRDPVEKSEAVTLGYLSQSLTSLIKNKDYIQCGIVAVGHQTSTNEVPLELTASFVKAGVRLQHMPPDSIHCMAGTYNIKFSLDAVFKSNLGTAGITAYRQVGPDITNIQALQTFFFYPRETSLGRARVTINDMISVPNVADINTLNGSKISFKMFGFSQTIYSLLTSTVIMERFSNLDSLLDVDNMPDHIIVDVEGISLVTVEQMTVSYNNNLSTITVVYVDQHQEEIIIDKINNNVNANYSLSKIFWAAPSPINGVVTFRTQRGYTWTADLNSDKFSVVNAQTKFKNVPIFVNNTIPYDQYFYLQSQELGAQYIYNVRLHKGKLEYRMESAASWTNVESSSVEGGQEYKTFTICENNQTLQFFMSQLEIDSLSLTKYRTYFVKLQGDQQPERLIPSVTETW